MSVSALPSSNLGRKKIVLLVSFHCDNLPNLLCLAEIIKYFVRFLQSASQVGLLFS